LTFAGAVSCGPTFDPASKVTSVRILATRADKPYAKPGDTVAVDLLAVDGRRDRPAQMALSWIPVPCIDPPGDAYYACYPAFAAALTPGVDLTPVLTQGPKLVFKVPDDVLSRTTSEQGGTRFGTIVVFSLACAGHVEYLGFNVASPEAVPFGCFDGTGRRLGPDDFVFAYTRLFVFDDRTNQNPEIGGITFGGQPVDLNLGITVDHCPTPSGYGAGAKSTCPTLPIDVVVPESSQEPDPSRGGELGKEAIWVDYYLTGGKIKDDVRIVYDAHLGRVRSEDDYEAPADEGDATVWAVVHDDRGGVNWVEMKVHTR
jgi:hypothetical protein